MALTALEQKKFRNWMIKSASGPILALLVLFWDLVFRNLIYPVHLVTLACLFFGGFPLWNIILEQKKGSFFFYHGLHFVLTFLPVYLLSQKTSLIPPFDLIICLITWLWSEAGLILLFPRISGEAENLRRWRQEKLSGLVQAHY